MPKLLSLVLASFFVGHLAAAQAPTTSGVLSDPEIQQLLAERIDQHKQSVGIVVGVIEPTGRRIVSYGKMSQNDARPLNGDSVFEIGSITKVFTSLLLANMAEHGEVALADPVAKYLPANVKLPERGGKQITLEDLATHTSGLPRMPANFKPKDQTRPYEDYQTDKLYEFLSGYKLTRDIGSKYEYSNLGVAVLGQALALHAGMDYESLVRTRILEPLGMNDTRITLTPAMQARLAVGYGYTSSGIEAVPNWEMDAFIPAGSLRSTAKDMLIFLSALLGYKETPLSKSMAAMLDVRRPIGGNEKVGLAWLTLAPRVCWFACVGQGNEIVYHAGATGGYQSFIGFDAKARIGVVILSNAGYGVGVADLGNHLLNGKLPLASEKAMRLPKTHQQISLDPALLESYVGRYRFPDKDVWTIRREGTRLFASHPAEPENEVFPESETSFFFKIVDAQIVFLKSRERRATGLIVHAAGQKDQRATRID